MKHFSINMLGNRWHWQISSESVLYPWCTTPESWICIKKNPVRAVYTVQDSSGNDYHIKYSTPKTLSSFFFRKLYSEFKNAQILRQSGIACPEAIGWGCQGNREILITSTIRHSITALQYWYETASLDTAARELFLKDLSHCVRSLWASGFWHGDFHLGNILRDASNGALLLIDLQAIHPRRWYHGKKIIHKMLNKLIPLTVSTTTDETINFVLSCGFADHPDKARSLLEEAFLFRQKQRAHKRPARIRKILAGDFPGCKKTRLKDQILYIRNTPWGTPMSFSETPENTRHIPHEEAQQLWLTTLLDESFSLKKSIPTAWLVTGKELDTIFYSIPE